MENNKDGSMEELKEFLQDYVKKEQARPPARVQVSPETRRRFAVALQIGVLVLACAYIWISLPAAKAVLSRGRPLRYGTYATERKTDECIKTLWGLAAGTVDAGSAVCPLSGERYRHAAGGFSCPAPEKHGLAVLSYVPGRGVEAFLPNDKRRNR